MWIIVLLSSFAFLIYRLTSYPGISWVDSGIIAAAVSSLGISNPPGFPLYMLLGKVFTLVPIGDISSRLQILSHLGAVILLFSVYIFVKRITGKALPAVFSFVALAFSYNLWSQAGNIETFTITNGFMYLFLLWVLEIDPKDSKKVLLAGLVGGILSGLNPVVSVLVPVGAWWVYKNRIIISKNLKIYIIASILAALGVVLIYSYLPIRALAKPYMNWGNPVNFENIRKHLVGEGLNIYEPETSSINGFTGQPKVWLESGLHYLQLGFYQFTPVLLPLVFLGAYNLWRSKNRYFWPLAIIIATNFVYVVLYYGGNQESWTITSWGVLAIFIGVGVEKIISWRPKLKWALLNLALLPLIFWFPILNHSKYTFGDDYSQNMYKDLPQSAVVIGGGDYFYTLTAYDYQVKKYRTDVTAVVGNMFYIFDWYREGLRNYGGLNVSKNLESMIKYKSVDEFTEVVDQLIAENPERQFYITPLLLRDTVVAGHKEGNYHTNKYKLIPNGLLFKIVPLNSVAEPNEELFKFSFKNPQIMAKAPFYMERNYKNAYKILKDDYAQSFAGLAEYYLAKGDKAKAEEYLLRSAEFSGPGSPQFYNRLAIFYIGEKRFAEARSSFEKALREDPENKDVLSNYQKFLGEISGKNENTKRELYEAKKFIFFYLPGWFVSEDKNGAVGILSPDKKFRIKITLRSKSDAPMNVTYGSLIQEGQAQIPNSDQTNIKVWNDRGVKKYEFDIFRGENVFNVLVYPADSPLMAEFDQLISTLELR
ncbi:MAG: DUF2723 domain-containing protein [Patescibacteria group bacterium]